MAHVERMSVAEGTTVERAVRIFLNEIPVAVSQGSPYGLEELAVGYLLAEGLVSEREELTCVRADVARDEVHVFSAQEAPDDRIPLHRVTSSGCAQSAVLAAACAKEADQPLQASVRFEPEALLRLMDELCENSPHRNAGECVHGCGLGSPKAENLLIVREDIGRHNAMDKTIGQAWLDRMPTNDKALLITGRISCEMALKAYRAACPVLVSRKAATDEAARRAEELGLTIVSSCRAGGMRVLTHPERILP